MTPLPPAAPPAALTVVVEGVRGAVGNVHVEVCDAASFMHRERCAFRLTVPAQNGRTVVAVPDVPAGEWAIQAYHDRNADGRVQQGPLGIPLEEVGFSRDASVGLHGPSFAPAAFTHDGPQTITVRLRRYLAP